jgi:hypothetical protein
MDNLELLKSSRLRLEILKKKRERSFGFWSAARYYAQDELWWDDFIHDNRIPWSELKYSVHRGSWNNASVTQDFLQKLWDERKGILLSIKKVYESIDSILEELIVVEGRDLSEVVPYYGASYSALYNAVKDRKWYKQLQEVKKAG